MGSLKSLSSELGAFASAVLALPLERFLCRDTIEVTRASGRSGDRPVVLVHGLLGNRVHFRALRAALEAEGIHRFATFCYRPRLDYQRLAPELGEFIDAVCEKTGASEVDVIGHSLGGLIARNLIENGREPRVRHLVTLASPYLGSRFPGRELSIFAADDSLIAAPVFLRRFSRSRVISGRGHISLLSCPEAHAEIVAFLKDERPARSNTPKTQRLVALAGRPSRRPGRTAPAARAVESPARSLAHARADSTRSGAGVSRSRILRKELRTTARGSKSEARHGRTRRRSS